MLQRSIRTHPGSIGQRRRFRTRIKRLLEIDRDRDLSNAEVPPEADYAFAPLPTAEAAAPRAGRAVASLPPAAERLS